MLVKVSLYLIMFGLCSFNYEESNLVSNSKITVVGIALNIKGGAIVDSDNGFYVVLGLDFWEDKYYGKKVKVTGKLAMVEHKKQSTDSVQVQEWVGKRRVIKKAKWRLVE